MSSIVRTAWLALAAFACLILSPLAAAQTARSATLSWSAPTAYTDGTPITGALTYQVYQGIGAGSTKTKAGTPVSGTTATISNGLSAGTTYCWQVSAIVAGQESALSNEACKTFPPQIPSAPASLTAQ